MSRTRIILDVDHLPDSKKCLELALDALRQDAGADWGYWSSRDPGFSAYIRSTKTGVSVHGRRKPTGDKS